MRGNVARDGGELSSGGGILVDEGSTLIATDSALVGNAALISVCAGMALGGGIGVGTSTVALNSSTFESNSVSAPGSSYGGAIYAGPGESKLSIATCSLLQNVAKEGAALSPLVEPFLSPKRSSSAFSNRGSTPIASTARMHREQQSGSMERCSPCRTPWSQATWRQHTELEVLHSAVPFL
jgi:hypothetical protein